MTSMRMSVEKAKSIAIIKHKFTNSLIFKGGYEYA